MAPMRPSFHIAAALLHESKARAKPCEASLHACLAFLSQLPAADLSRLQLQLPLRYPLPDSCLALLLQRGSRLHQQLTSLRLSRVSLTEPLAQGLGALPALRHLCMAHANLIALPQLLAAATQLEHLHVGGGREQLDMQDWCTGLWHVHHRGLVLGMTCQVDIGRGFTWRGAWVRSARAANGSRVRSQCTWDSSGARRAAAAVGSSHILVLC